MVDDVINRDPEIMGGTPVFCGTRVPIRVLWDHLEAGIPLAEFLADYPTVQREQVTAVLKHAADILLGESSETSAR